MGGRRHGEAQTQLLWPGTVSRQTERNKSTEKGEGFSLGRLGSAVPKGSKEQG